MALINNKAENRKYITILADGKLHMTVPEGTEGATMRHYELKDGTKGSKLELVFTEVSGIITNINLKDGNYGQMLEATITDAANGEDPVVLSVGVNSNFAEDLMKKLPNISLTLPVRLVPFSFTDDKGKARKGITVYQDQVKVESYYHESGTFNPLNGYPSPQKDQKLMKKPDWKKFYGVANDFLVEETRKRFVTPTPSSDIESLAAEMKSNG